MQLVQWTVQNFLSVGPAVTVTPAPLFAVVGENGSGKTSLFRYALAWLFYGRAHSAKPEGLEGAEVVNRFGEGDAFVRAVLDDAGVTWTVERRVPAKGKTTKLAIAREGVDKTPANRAEAEKTVRALVGRLLRLFEQQVAISRWGKSFAAMTDAEKKDLFREFSGTAALEQAADMATERAKLQAKAFAAAQSRVDVATARTQDLEIAVASAQASRQQRVEAANRRHDDVLRDLDDRRAAQERVTEPVGLTVADAEREEAAARVRLAEATAARDTLRTLSAPTANARDAVTRGEHALGEVVGCEIALAEAQKDLDAAQREEVESYAAREESRRAVLAAFEATRSDLAALKTELSHAEVQRDFTASRLAGVQDFALDGPCPTCEQTVPHEHAARVQALRVDERAKLQAQLDTHRAEVERIQRLIAATTRSGVEMHATLQAALTADEARHEKARGAVTKARSAEQAATVALHHAEKAAHDLDAARGRLADLEAQAARLAPIAELSSVEALNAEVKHRAETTTRVRSVWEAYRAARAWLTHREHAAALDAAHREHAAALDAAQGPEVEMLTARLAEVEAERAAASVEATAAEREREMWSQWADAFGPSGLQSELIREGLPAFNERLAHYLSLLCNRPIEAELSAETTLKTGEARERMSLRVDNAAGAATYHANSDGEIRRIDHAVALACGDQAAAYAGRPLGLRIFDEPFDGLDDAGIDDFARALQRLSAEGGFDIGVITHDARLALQFPVVLHVERDDDGFTRIRDAAPVTAMEAAE